MKLSTLFTINAVLSLLFGLGFLLAPAMQLEGFGATSSAPAELIARTYGGALLGVAVMLWMMRKTELSVARTAVVWGLIVQHAISAIVLALGITGGVLNGMGWIAVVLDVLLTVGFVMYGRK